MAQPPRELKDQALRTLFQHVAGASLAPLGVPTPPLVEALSPVVSWVQSRAVVVDGLLGDAEDGLWHLEFEMSSTDAWRTIRHHVAVRDAHPGRPVHTVLLWGRRRNPVGALRDGSLILECHEVLLPRMEGGPILRQLEAWAAAGRELGPEEGMLLALVPLMTNALSLPQIVARGAALRPALREDVRVPVLESMNALAYSQGNATERRRIREVLHSMPTPQQLYRDLRKEARAQGLAEGERTQAREAVLDLFSLRFGDVPDGVRAAIGAQDDLATLRAWRRAIVRAATTAEAQAAILDR